MGKKGRAANRLRREEAREQAVGLIGDATVAVGTWFDNDAQCVEGCSLLVAVLQSLGLNARVQPVHTLAFFDPDDAAQTLVVATGEGAVDFALANELGHPEWDWDAVREQAAGTDWSGHTVVVVDEPGTILDPTFGQFTRLGFPDRVIYIRVADPERPVDGSWAVQPNEFDGRFRVYYIPEDRDREILEKAKVLTHSWQEVASSVASQLRRGGVRNVTWPMTWAHYKTIDPVRDFS